MQTYEMSDREDSESDESDYEDDKPKKKVSFVDNFFHVSVQHNEHLIEYFSIHHALVSRSPHGHKRVTYSRHWNDNFYLVQTELTRTNYFPRFLHVILKQFLIKRKNDMHIEQVRAIGPKIVSVLPRSLSIKEHWGSINESRSFFK